MTHQAQGASIFEDCEPFFMLDAFANLASLPWLWVPITLFAAAAQTVRNTAQRTLTDEVGPWSATLVRFLFGLPLTIVWVLLLYGLPGSTALLPPFSLPYLGWIGMGAFFQIFATAALLRAMQERNFAVAVTLSKTEVLQVALFGVVLLHELPTAMAVLAMLVATLGVLALSLPRQGQLLSWRAWCSKSALYGLLAGAGFAISTIGFRGGALALGDVSPWVSGAWGVLIAQSLQSLGMGGWVAARGGLGPIFRAWRISLLAGSMGAAASLAWFTAYAMHTVADVRTLGMIEVVFSYLVSRRVLRERLTRAEQVGMALMLLGLGITLNLF